MTEKSATYWYEASRSFNSVPADYDAYRPGYPRELVDSLIELTGISPSGKILEIGAGTGKATRLLAERGFSILCIEPGPALAVVAARNLQAFPVVQFEVCRFEDWQGIANSFDLVFSAQAFHWVPKEVGYARAARALKSQGYLALFWNTYPGFKGKLAADLDKIYQEIAPELKGGSSSTEAAIQNRVGEMEASGNFGPVTVRRFPWSIRYTSRQYQGLMNTYSDHLLLPEAARQKLFKAVGDLIDSYGGSIERPYDAVLYVAQKLPQR
jgi:SAM-dependent methyltransferase